jgi:RNA polymerase sigma factor for flagellar operon FliA
VSNLGVVEDRQVLFEEHIEMVYRIAKYYTRKWSPFCPYDEIRQWGLMGLWDACCKFNGPRDEFNFYAQSRIRGQILDGIRSFATNRRQRGLSKVRPKFKSIEDYSLVANEPPVDDQIHARVELKKVLAALKTLTERELYIVLRYFFDYHTLAEIAEVLDITEARVSQVKDMALDKLAIASSGFFDP